MDLDADRLRRLAADPSTSPDMRQVFDGLHKMAVASAELELLQSEARVRHARGETTYRALSEVYDAIQEKFSECVFQCGRIKVGLKRAADAEGEA